MRRNFSLALMVTLGTFIQILSAQQKHFLHDPSYRQSIEQAFQELRHHVASRADQLFSAYDASTDDSEKEAFQFLCVGMPLNDLADADGDYLMHMVRTAFEARRTFSWGENIPEDIFRHYVLPHRVNTENLDSSRMVFFRTLKERIKNLSMHDAALEVNHWCHEKATYQPTDERTESPLMVCQTGFGRCGEESTLLISALRAVSIPARQCYTPRWAHQDDNHGWVEVWVDGGWHYMGGCEPEPDLDMAWFTEPVRRAMLVTIKVYGPYNGAEEVIIRGKNYALLNVLSHYASVKKMTVRVLNRSRKPVASAIVDFSLFNSAEFYPLATFTTDEQGYCSLTTGIGDLVIWARKGSAWNFQKVSVETTDTIRIIIDVHKSLPQAVTMDLVPPVEREPVPPQEKGIADNMKRLQVEDSLRAVYRSTFIPGTEIHQLAVEFHLDSTLVKNCLTKSAGNHRTLVQFLRDAPDSLKSWALTLLTVLSDKDLRDVTHPVLQHHLLESFRNGMPDSRIDRELFTQYILSPRVAHEMLVPYRTLFQNFSKTLASFDGQHVVPSMIRWIERNITIEAETNQYGVPLTPRGVLELRLADATSRDIFFVAWCRSLAIPARLEPATKIPQFYKHGTWKNVIFERSTSISPYVGTVTLTYAKTKNQATPEYGVHYTLARYIDGKFSTLDFEPQKSFPRPFLIEAGSYMLVTGNRQSDGSVLSHVEFFSLSPNKKRTIPLTIRDSAMSPKEYGTLPRHFVLSDKNGNPSTLGELAQQSGILLAWIEPDQEPTKHFLNDLESQKSVLEQWGGPIILQVINDESGRKNLLIPSSKLSSQSFTVNDSGGMLYKRFASELKKPLSHHFPLVVFLDQNGSVLYRSEGYRIGIGEQISNLIRSRIVCKP